MEALVAYAEPLVRPDTSHLNSPQEQLRARGMLGLAVALLSFGGAVATVLGIVAAVRAPLLNFRGEPFSSSYGYVPNQISFMVKDPTTPQGVIFQAFFIVGGLTMLFSWYPWVLSNVRLLETSRPQCCSRCTFLTLRSFLPAVGLIILAAVHLPLDDPDDEATAGAQLQDFVHSTFAVVFFAGYLIFEMWALYYGSFASPLCVKERRMRKALAWGSVLSFVCFSLVYSSASNADALGICCKDVWAVPTFDDVAAARHAGHDGLAVEAEISNEKGVKMLLDTASSVVRQLKFLCLVFEVSGFMSIIGSLAAIVYFSPGDLPA